MEAARVLSASPARTACGIGNSRTFQHVFICSHRMRIERSQIQNFIGGEFVEPISLLVIPSEVEESLDISPRSLL
jgi:hypothetical protein